MPEKRGNSIRDRAAIAKAIASGKRPNYPMHYSEVSLGRERNLVPDQVPLVDQFTGILAYSDEQRKSGNYEGALSALQFASSYLSDLPQESRTKYFDAIDKRLASVLRAHPADKLEKDEVRFRHHLGELVSRGFTGNEYIARRPPITLAGGRINLAASIIGILGGIFFLSPVFTGNVIAGSDIKLNVGIGALMFIVGLVAGFFFFRNKRKSKVSLKRKRR